MFRFDRKYIRNVVAGTWAIVSLSLGWCVSYAQGVDTLGANTSPTSAAAATVDTEALSKRIELVADAESLDDATKSRLLEQLRLAQARVTDAAEHASAKEQFNRQAAAAPQAIADIKRQLSRPTDDPRELPTDANGAPLNSAELRERLVQARNTAGNARTRVENLEAQLIQLRARPPLARQALSIAQDAAREVEESLAALTAERLSEHSFSVQRLVLSAQLRARVQEIQRLQAELFTHDARLELTTTSLELALRNATFSEAQAESLELAISERRRRDAEAAREEAERSRDEAAGKHPAVVELAELNAELGQQLHRLAQNIESTRSARQQVEEELTGIEQRFASVKEKIEVAGLSPALSQVLLEERRRLPSDRTHIQQTLKRAKEISAAGLARLQAEERKRALNDLTQAGTEWLDARVPADLSLDVRAPLSIQIGYLLVDQKRLVDDLESNYTTYTQSLSELDFHQRKLVDIIERYREFLDHRMLWIPSAPPVGVDTIRYAVTGVNWLLDYRAWLQTIEDLGDLLSERPWIFLGTLLLILLRVAKRRFIRGLDDAAAHVGRIYSDRFGITARTAALSFLIALPLPALAMLVGFSLASFPGATNFSAAVGLALGEAGQFLFLVTLLTTTCLHNGLCPVHFGWTERTVSVIRSQVTWFAPIAVATSFALVVTFASGEETFRQGLGRLAFAVGQLALALFLYRLLSPKGGITQSAIEDAPNSWFARLEFLWLPTAVATPLILTGISLYGYEFAAYSLVARVSTTIWTILGAVLLYGFILRWVWLTSRRLELMRAYEEKMAALEAEHEGDTPLPQNEALDLESIDAQTRRLVSTLLVWATIAGLWVSWVDILPALGFLESFVLWDTNSVTDGATITVPVTALDLSIALILALLSLAAARNLPGLLEVALLRRLPIDAGARHAITTTVQYVIVGAGVIVVFDIAGLAWGDIQWLVAALSVGLGFGLQEIVANFISGLIILFERPIRLGDTVTVGEFSGTVTRIRIRATTLVDWDNKEVVVPNKTFITERLVNWTLTDSVTRVVIPVGIGYGSDTELAHKIMLDLANEQNEVLDSPAPSAYFIGLGASSLDFEVRMYVRSLADRLVVTHAYLMNLEKRLAEHDIAIPFPQRDLHIKDPERLAAAMRESLAAKPAAEP